MVNEQGQTAADSKQRFATLHLSPAFAWSIVVALCSGAMAGGSIIWTLSAEVRDVRTVTDAVVNTKIIERVNRLEDRQNFATELAVSQAKVVSDSLTEVKREIQQIRQLIIEQIRQGNQTFQGPRP